jgi:hypothetical protein
VGVWMTVEVTDSSEEHDEDRSIPGWVYVTPPCEAVRTFRPTSSTMSCGTAKVGVTGASVSTGLTGDDGTEGSKQYCDKKGSKSSCRGKPSSALLDQQRGHANRIRTHDEQYRFR